MEDAVEDAVGFQHHRLVYATVEYKLCGVADYPRLALLSFQLAQLISRQVLRELRPTMEVGCPSHQRETFLISRQRVSWDGERS